MKQDVLIDKLKAIGFSQKEAIVYLATLQAGTAPASLIAQGANMNRVTTYGILEKLFQKGIVMTSVHQKMQHFTALAPEVLIEKTKQQADNLAASLPSLQSLREIQAFVRFFKGIGQVKQAYKESLSTDSEILNYGNSKNIRDHWPEYDEEYVLQRKQHKIFLSCSLPRNLKNLSLCISYSLRLNKDCKRRGFK